MVIVVHSRCLAGSDYPIARVGGKIDTYQSCATEISRLDGCSPALLRCCSVAFEIPPTTQGSEIGSDTFIRRKAYIFLLYPHSSGWSGLRCCRLHCGAIELRVQGLDLTDLSTNSELRTRQPLNHWIEVIHRRFTPTSLAPNILTLGDRLGIN